MGYEAIIRLLEYDNRPHPSPLPEGEGIAAPRLPWIPAFAGMTGYGWSAWGLGGAVGGGEYVYVDGSGGASVAYPDALTDCQGVEGGPVNGDGRSVDDDDRARHSVRYACRVSRPRLRSTGVARRRRSVSRPAPFGKPLSSYPRCSWTRIVPFVPYYCQVNFRTYPLSNVVGRALQRMRTVKLSAGNRERRCPHASSGCPSLLPHRSVARSPNR